MAKKYRKALYKTLTWRIVSSGTLFLLALVFTDSLETAAAFTLVYVIVKTILYYFHELAWQGKSRYIYGNKRRSS